MSMPEKLGELNGKWTAWFKLAQVLQPFVMAMISALFCVVWWNSMALAEIKGNRYTSEDARKVENRWNANLLDVIGKMDLAFIRFDDRIDAIELNVARLPSEVPPTWFRDEVRDIEKRLERLEQKGSPE